MTTNKNTHYNDSKNDIILISHQKEHYLDLQLLRLAKIQ